MRGSTIIKFIIVSLFFRPEITSTSAQPDLTCSYCNDTNGNYTSSSIYSTNLKSLLGLISANAQQTQNGYYFNATVGAGSPDSVNGIAVCRADRSPKDCRDCLSSATVMLAQVCPVQKEAIGYYTGDCMLRYSNNRIFQSRENGPNCTMPQGPNKVPAADTEKLKQSLLNLLTGLQRNASAGNSSYKFASGVVDVTASITLYGLAQCNPSLSSVECSGCLGQVTSRLQKCCANLNGINVNGLVCSLAFANYPVLTRYSDSSPQEASRSGTVVDDRNQSGNREKNAHKTWIIVVSVLSLMLILVAFFGLLRRRMRKRPKQEDSFDDMKLVDSIQLDFDSIQLATDNFCSSKRLDHGGQTAMYKGLLPDGQEILVKRLDNGVAESVLDFDKEVLLSANLQHKNLVKLLSFCVEKDLRILVYELLPNGSLEGFLNDPVKRASLDWQTRYHIIGGLARGLLYLHEDSQVRVIHRDLKPSNIFLDTQMNPKISNFKTASLIQGAQTTSEDTKVVGTYGYMPLEYVRHGHSSIMSDIFSYGVILLEIITGYTISGFSNEDTEESLLTYAWGKWSNNTTLEIVDDALQDVERHVEQIKRCIKISLLCVQEDRRHRPMMSTVGLMLNSDTVDVANPTRPSPLILNNIDLNSLSE
ncbi:hypothetical protein vseg_017412 [Gypsophila vaccaria]